MTEIQFYETLSGRCPIQEFLDTLEPKVLAKAFRTIDLLENNGSSLRGPYSKQLKNGIFELRTKQGTNTVRILYFFFAENIAVLTNGFIKKTNKTPETIIELAMKYKIDYEKRK